MKLRIIIWIAVCLLGSTVASAQDPCSAVPLKDIPGKYREGTKGSVSGVPAADLPKQRALVTRVVDMFKKNYAPKGMNIITGGAHVAPPVPLPNGLDLGNPYYASFYLMRFYCDHTTKLAEVGETSSRLEVVVNQWPDFNRFSSFFVKKQVDEEDPMTNVFSTLQYRPVFRDGYWLFRDTVMGGFQKQITRIRYLLTADDRLPFVYVTRKEYAEKHKKFLQEKMDLEKKNTESGSGEYLRQSIDKLDAYLAGSGADELNAPATIRGGGPSLDFEGFYAENERYKDFVIKPDPAYYRSRLPGHTPRFIAITFYIDENDPIYVKAWQDMLQAIDFKALKALIGNPAAAAASPAAKPAATPTPPVANKPLPPQQVLMTGSSAKKGKDMDIYSPSPTKGFVSTPVSQLKNAVQLPVVNAAVKAAALQQVMTATNRKALLDKLLADIQKQLQPKEQQQQSALLAGTGNNPVALADLGVLLYYKDALGLSLWSLARAATLQPESDYILSNLSAILVQSGAAPRALPVLRYLAAKHPRNSTVLNNLGQAWFALGEMAKSKAALDSSLRISPAHPQANYTRAAIAEKEGNQAAAAAFLQKSLRGAYNSSTEKLASKKGIRTDWGNTWNRRRPLETEYINPLKFRQPEQLLEVQSASVVEGRWKAWSAAVEAAQARVQAGMQQSSVNYENMTNAGNWKVDFANGMLAAKAAYTYQVYLDKLADLNAEAGAYMQGGYEKAKVALEEELSVKTEAINNKYMGGEGQNTSDEQRCKELDLANNNFLKQVAALNEDFIARFTDPIRLLHIEMSYWCQLLPEPANLREMKYYQHMTFALGPVMPPPEIIYPCGDDAEPVKETWDPIAFEYKCPISFKFKILLVKLNGDCDKFEVEAEFSGLVANYERDFINKKSTLAFGAGLGLDLANKDAEGISQNSIVADEIPEFVELAGAGVGTKVQGFIEWDNKGVICDGGIRGEASLEGPFSDKGDIKVNGKMGVNSGVEVTATPAAHAVVESINQAITGSSTK